MSAPTLSLPAMRNAEIAAAFTELGTLYELDGANRFRVLAYKEAARVIRDSPSSIADLARAGKATEMQGIGKTIQEKIVALLDEGEIPAGRKLKAKFPATLVDITRLPGVGAKTARLIYDELGIATLEDLRAAAEDERLRGVRGLGEKFEQNVLASVDKLAADGPEERRLLDDVRAVGIELVEALEENPASEHVVMAGSARRWAETCKDIDIIATATDPLALSSSLAEHHLIAESGKPGSQRPPGPNPQRDRPRPADRPAGGARQPAPALHRQQGAQREAAGARREDGPVGLRARDRRRRIRRGDPMRDRGRGLRAARPRLHRAGAAPGIGRAGARRGGRAARAGHPR